MPFGEVQHQEQALSLLSRALRSDRLPHAYIFYGPHGVGKVMTARALAATVLCENGPFREVTGGCGACRQCGMVAAGTHPDLHIVERQLSQFSADAAVRARRSTDLSVEVIREHLIDKAASRPYCGRAKLFVVREAEKMTVAAQNALLKTLEEPPPNTVLILLATDPTRLTPTTRSRCQLVPFRPLPTEFVARWLSEHHPELAGPASAYLAAFADGQIGAAGVAAALGLHDHKREVVAQLISAPPPSPATLAETLLDAGKAMAASLRDLRDDLSDAELNREALKLLLSALAAVFDDALRVAVGRAEPIVNSDQPDEVSALAGRLPPESACQIIRRLATAQYHLDMNANAQLAVEALSRALCGSLEQASPAPSPA